MKELYQCEINKINNKTYHIYNYNSKMHLEIGLKEYNLLLNSDDEFIQYLKNMNFFKKPILRNKILNYKISIIKSNFKKNIYTDFMEKLIWICLMFSLLWFTILYNPKIHITIQGNIFEYYIIVFISLLLHELSHWLFSINRNVMIPEIGINFKCLLPLPMMYTDGTGIRYISNYLDRICCVYSGILINILILSSSYILWYYTKEITFLNIWEINVNIILFNIAWYLKFDGYYTLSFFLGNDVLSNQNLNIEIKIIKIIINVVQIIFFLYVIYSIIGGFIWK